MSSQKKELRDRFRELQSLHGDVHEAAFVGKPWAELVVARRTLGDREKIEFGFLAEQFLLTWSNWTGLVDRYCRFFGRQVEDLGKRWPNFIASADLEVYYLVRKRHLDDFLASEWTEPQIFPERGSKAQDPIGVFSLITLNHERATLLDRASRLKHRARGKRKTKEMSAIEAEPVALERTRQALDIGTRTLLGLWFNLPRRTKESLWFHLRHYLRSTLTVSWLVEPSEPSSALMRLVEKEQMQRYRLIQTWSQLSAPVPEPVSSVARLLDRIITAIAELGYEGFVEEALSPDFVGGDDSPLGTEDAMVLPGHQGDQPRPIVLALTRARPARELLTFARVMQQVKTRLIEGGDTTRTVIVLCESWDSTTFRVEHHDELAAWSRKGVAFEFFLVGVPDQYLTPIPVGFELVPG
jgi:hypothetical protein